MSEGKGIYELELHEEIHIDLCGEKCYAMRVPGGWIYKFWPADEGSVYCVFVPYSPWEDERPGPWNRIVKAGDPDLIANE